MATAVIPAQNTRQLLEPKRSLSLPASVIEFPARKDTLQDSTFGRCQRRARPVKFFPSAS